MASPPVIQYSSDEDLNVPEEPGEEEEQADLKEEQSRYTLF